MPKGISIHVGVNVPLSSAFDAPPLVGAETDARFMHELARAEGFEGPDTSPADPTPPLLLLGAAADIKTVTEAIEKAAAALKAGDIFLFTFAGHGGRKADRDLDDSELEDILLNPGGGLDPFTADFKDETLVLHDRVLLDDYLRRALWPKFAEGVRILMVSDSCHSGGSLLGAAEASAGAKAAAPQFLGAPAPTDFQPAPRRPRQTTWRQISVAAGRQHFNAPLFKDFYLDQLKDLPLRPPINASLLLLAACDDNKTTPDGDPHGAFTAALRQVWEARDTPAGRFADYKAFRDKIKLKLQPQVPRLRAAGKPDPGFAAQPPFSI